MKENLQSNVNNENEDIIKMWEPLKFDIGLNYKYVKNKYVKWISIILLSLLICLIGISRIYLGVHYTSDVLGGFLISISYLIIYISAANKFIIEKE